MLYLFCMNIINILQIEEKFAYDDHTKIRPATELGRGL